ncbi:hypothetical protein LGH70_06515 [Hymenobacter sp. BT635]|uniref:Uncharacterized protein n=1 Tax=Hymenobacter nitidus TaxID=2880929 RepID=A0ABS8ABB8_9BACT|nr:hypothetical protein [Hymenobacter nitidus]MCB2377227.1 hypothetical protein [Hymenobacter nitidus]
MATTTKNKKINRTNWFDQLDVVNCGAFHSQQEANAVYACPAKGGAYSHKRSQYLGMYWNKSVQRVARIKGVVDVNPLAEGTEVVRWNNEDPAHYSNRQLIADARQRLHACFPPTNDNHRKPHRVFVLDEVTPTSFEKDSPGGMLSSKRYFWVGGDQVRAANAPALAENLRRFKWSDWK